MKILKVGVGIALASLMTTTSAAAAQADRGSVQAALDNLRWSGLSVEETSPVAAFYRAENMSPQWSTAMAQRVTGLLVPAAGALLSESSYASFYLAQLDVQTSVQAVRIINAAKGKNYPQQTATVVELQQFKQAVAKGMAEPFLVFLSESSTLMQQLQRAERKYSSVVAAGGWALIPKNLNRLSNDKRAVLALKQRLIAEGYEAGDGAVFDMTLQRMLRQYQGAQGLNVNGVLDKATRTALNVTAWRRLQTVRANMARFAKQKSLVTEDNVIVNIPAFEGKYFNQGKQAWSDRVIVGKRDRRTPQIHSKIQKVVLNPSWYVPSTIVHRDILPRASRNPSYWNRMGYLAYDRKGRIFDIEAGSQMQSVFSENSLRIKQPPGPRNALGQVKFLFPNRHAVYLHDTPNKKLFSRDVRTFSSGCVRVNDPLRLAEVLFQNQTRDGHRGLEGSSVEQVLAENKTRVFRLDKPVEVNTIYLTAEPLASGRIRFHRDVYKYDTAALASRAVSLQSAAL